MDSVWNILPLILTPPSSGELGKSCLPVRTSNLGLVASGTSPNCYSFPFHTSVLPTTSSTATMHLQFFLLSSLACLSSSIPHRPFGPHTQSYFESLGGRYGMVRKHRENMVSCREYDIDQAAMPMSLLPSPTTDSKVLTVALGTGTQVSLACGLRV